MPGSRPIVLGAVLLLAVLEASFSHPAHAGDLAVREHRGMYGLYDGASGNFVVEPKYEKITALEGAFYKAVSSGRAGIINASGDVLVDFKYHELYKVGKHYIARVDFESTTFGTPQRRGNVIVNTKYHVREYKHGLLDGEGNVVIPVEHGVLKPLAYPVLFQVGALTDYEQVGANTHHARFRYGVIDIFNNVIVPIEYDDVRLVKDATNPNKVVVAYSRKGSPQQTLEYEIGKATAAGTPSRGETRKIVKFRSAGLFGFKTTRGEVVVDPLFEDAWDFRNGYARVKKDGKWGFVAESGKIVVEPKYDYAWDFDDGKARVRLDDGSTLLIDPEGKRLDKP